MRFYHVWIVYKKFSSLEVAQKSVLAMKNPIKSRMRKDIILHFTLLVNVAMMWVAALRLWYEPMEAILSEHIFFMFFTFIMNS